MNYLLKADRALLKWAYQRPFKKNMFIKILIFTGDGPFWLLLIFFSALAGQVLNIESLNHLAVLLMTGMFIGNVIFYLLKTRVKRKRPYSDLELQHILNLAIENRDPGHGSKELESFPSGHVLWTTISVILICSLFGYIPVLLIGWLIPAMMFLRPYLGVHYPSDALASLLLGSADAWITLVIFQKLAGYMESLKEYPVFIYAYWLFIILFIAAGFKSWLKRV